MRSNLIEMILVCLVSLLLSTFFTAVHAHAALNTWESIGPSGARVWALAIDPINSSVLYATTSSGLYKSIDAGVTWDLNTVLGSTYVSSIAVNPDNTSIIYVGISSGMQKSTDGGATWNPFNSGITNTAFKSIVIDPSLLTTLYVATYGGGIFKSTGDAWSPVNIGMTPNLNVQALVINPLTPAILYAGTDGGGVFRSLNSGGTWEAVNTGLTDKHIYALAIDPSTPVTVYAGTYSGGIFKSTDSGGTWNAINTELTDKYVRALAINPESTGILYAGTSDGGVFKGSSGSGHWNMVNDGLTHVNIKALVVDPVSPTTVYAGTDGGGVFKTTFGYYTVTTGFSGTGRGSVASDPTGMACGSGCSRQFEFASHVTLSATAADYSTFDGWTGACFGTSCGLTMDADKIVGAIFNLDTTHKARIPYPAQFLYFSTLQAAYNSANSVYPVQAWGTDFTGDLNAADAGNKAVTLKGGYNGAYNANNGYTTLHGSLTVTKGTLTVERLIIR
jgi:photosystem II stability/assembly factor-like uncharacterized protein